jgi:hypothetical protein
MRHGRSAVVGGQYVRNECEFPEVLQELVPVAEDLEKALMNVSHVQWWYPSQSLAVQAWAARILLLHGEVVPPADQLEVLGFGSGKVEE